MPSLILMNPWKMQGFKRLGGQICWKHVGHDFSPGLFLLASRVAMILYIYRYIHTYIYFNKHYNCNTSNCTHLDIHNLISFQFCVEIDAFLGSIEPGYFNGSKDGDTITAIAFEAQLAATGEAFALYRCGGDRVLTWGNPRRR